MATGAQHSVNGLCGHKRLRREVYTAIVAVGGALAAVGLLVPRRTLTRALTTTAAALIVLVGLVSFRNRG